MSNIRLEQVLKEESQAIDEEAEARGSDFKSKYQFWMFAEGLYDGCYELKEDHIVDAKSLLTRLAPQPAGFEKTIFDQLNPGLQGRVQKAAKELAAQPSELDKEKGPSAADLEDVMKELLPELNATIGKMRSRIFKQEKRKLLDDINNPERLLNRLAPQRDKFSEIIFGRFSPELRERVAQSGDPEGKGISEAELKNLMRKVVGALNEELAKRAPLFSEAEEKDLSESEQDGLESWNSLKDCFKNSRSDLRQNVWNRVLLQAAFPKEIAKVWDTFSGICAWSHAHPRNALCLSGGGIRSATFGLGVIQTLARNGLLDKFHFLSTVSGGGYIGGWLSAWSSHGGFEQALSDLKGDPNHNPLETEPGPLMHLRQYSNYLTPKLGLTSADTWTLIATYVRNLALNWVVFIPMLAALLTVPRISVAILQLAAPTTIAYVLLGVGALLGMCAISYSAWNRPSLRRSRKPYRTRATFLWCCLAPLYLSSVCFAGLWGWVQNGRNNFTGPLALLLPGGGPLPAMPFLLLGVGVHVLAWTVYVWKLKKGQRAEFIFCVLSGLAAGFLLWRGAGACFGNLKSPLALQLFVCFGTPYYFLCFLLSVFLFVGMVSHWTDDEDREWWARMGAWLLLAAVGWTLFSVLVLFGPEWLMKLPRLLALLGGISGGVTLFLSHSGLTAANQKQEGEAGMKLLPVNRTLAVAAPIFVASFVAALSLGTTWLIEAVPLFGKHLKCDGGTVLSEQAIVDLPFLAARLREHAVSDRPSEYLWSRFDAALRSQLEGYENSEAQTKALRASLVAKFNDIIQKGRLIATNAFQPEPGSISEGVKSHLSAYHDNERKMQHNRFLLEQKYSRELASARFDHRMITYETPLRKAAALGLILAGVSLILSWVIDINRFSLHAVYRNRLIRAYLGASNPNRQPNVFTGFDPADNLRLAMLRHKPFHLVNIALNLVAGNNLAWQQRKAESFTASPLHAGSWRLGYRNVDEYCSRISHLAPAPPPEDKKQRGLTLGTAVTISGAAVSPNMGYHSSPVISVLMTLFNIRLGAWLGNPSEYGDRSYKDLAPRSALWSLLLEALGLTDEKTPYVYLSDGGHFENLGLYEMVLRRCRYIVLSDAGCDPNCALEDLGNAIRKIRIDFGIPIEIQEFRITSRKDPQSAYCALGKIWYSKVDGNEVKDDGDLIYIKPAISGTEERDIFNYKETSGTFPHESTADQWFSESQFESYRALGAHIIRTICDGDQKNAWATPREKPEAALEYFRSQIDAYLSRITNHREPLDPNC